MNIIRVENTSKRRTWIGDRLIGFNKAKTSFYEVAEKEIGTRSRMPWLNAIELIPTAEEREAILAAWRGGRVAWMLSHNLIGGAK